MGRGAVGRAAGCINPSTDYSFGVFARDPEGVPSASRTVTVRGSAMSFTGPDRLLSEGDKIRLTDRLRSAAGAPIKGKTIQTYWRSGRVGPWKPRMTVRTDEIGRFKVRHQVATRTGQYRAVYWGGRRFGDTDGPVITRVAR